MGTALTEPVGHRAPQARARRVRHGRSAAGNALPCATCAWPLPLAARKASRTRPLRYRQQAQPPSTGGGDFPAGTLTTRAAWPRPVGGANRRQQANRTSRGSGAPTLGLTTPEPRDLVAEVLPALRDMATPLCARVLQRLALFARVSEISGRRLGQSPGHRALPASPLMVPLEHRRPRLKRRLRPHPSSVRRGRSSVLPCWPCTPTWRGVRQISGRSSSR
jgi:hypothetical protein